MVSTLTNNSTNDISIVINNNFALGKSSKKTQYLTRSINNKKYHIVFEGNILNREKIKEYLFDKNYTLVTNNDAELVLLHYVELQESCLNFFDGSFAFAIYDGEKLFLARDRLGLIPLFYNQEDTFIFASEIKSLLKHSDIKAKIGKDEICEIFGLGPAHTPGKTFFKDIYELLPGHYAKIENNNINIKQYWDLETVEIKDTIENATVKIKELVTNSLNNSIIATSPICSMLSRWFGLKYFSLSGFKKNRKFKYIFNRF